MSVEALYRVMVRMLYDPALVDAVYRDRATALVEDELGEVERSWLVAVDERAWRTDPMRRARSVTGLIEEFPVASACVVRRMCEGTVRVETELLDAFFSARVFHEGVRRGESMVLAFARYLEGPEHGSARADRRIAPLAGLEAAIARLRRVVESDPGPAVPERFYLAPWAEVLRVPAGTGELHTRISKALRLGGRSPVASVLDRQWSLPVLLELDAAAQEDLLIERPPEAGTEWSSVGVRYAPVTAELAGLLRAVAPGATRGELLAVARALGAEPGEDADVLDGLIGEGLLVRAG